MHNSVKVFVPGRLCLFGEHSDWASSYKSINKNIKSGMAIVASISEGITAEVSVSDKVIITEKKYRKIICNYNEIDNMVSKNPFWKYALCTIIYLKNKFQDLGGININITKVTLPMKKGLGSSAAICLLVTKAYNLLYKLGLTENEELEIAYQGELLAGSKCGKLDQVNNLLGGISCVEFDNNEIKTRTLIIGQDLYMVYADLNGTKDTVKILSDLNSCYPFPNNKKEEKVHEFLGNMNQSFLVKACNLLEKGLIEDFGKLMTEYQRCFDECLIDICSELKAPLLHQILNDENVKKLIYGGKGCGSGGDGTVQFVVKDKESQIELIKYLTSLGFNCKKIVFKSNKIKKAIIPVGGFGTRMYPMTKIIGKEFLPVRDSLGTIKPAILILIEELIEAGIEKIALVLPKKYQKKYIEFFSNDYIDGFEEDTIKLKKIFSKITFIEDKYQQGLGKSIKLCKKFINNETFMLLLGDQIYKSSCDKSCVRQILDFYYKKFLPIIPVCETKLDDVSNYGILYGKIWVDENSFYIEKIVEKPSVKFAKENLQMTHNNKKVFYSIFGCYILEPSIINDDLNFSTSLCNYINKNKSIAFIPNGRYFDIGNMKSYYDTFINFGNEVKYEEKS